MPDYAWQVSGVSDAGQSSVFLLALYPVLLLLVILSAFVKYVWIALALYCALMVLFSCTARFCALPEPAGSSAVDRGGLSEAGIAAIIPAFAYDAAAASSAAVGDGGQVQCAVCLETLRSGETVRRLPVCAHTFHVGCIGMWLHSHTTCPVCRRHLEPRKSGKMMVPPLPPV
ncbi:RING-H2 finger protein ATL32 [Brachypodium distachyon]|uniref:RING-H2 finger protein ATL32 n=1 Tax=Brachypodium distachyon TaxID=15368 RepID=UPI0001D42EF6|nr:RING-H2 finger protein ATL32 [Brachypodium distachyon]|eukprot:XP_003560697.1 RING-H2 finger protein ATL32 [Brachypodium distachyon]